MTAAAEVVQHGRELAGERLRSHARDGDPRCACSPALVLRGSRRGTPCSSSSQRRHLSRLAATPSTAAPSSMAPGRPAATGGDRGETSTATCWPMWHPTSTPATIPSAVWRRSNSARRKGARDLTAWAGSPPGTVPTSSLTATAATWRCWPLTVVSRSAGWFSSLARCTGRSTNPSRQRRQRALDSQPPGPGDPRRRRRSALSQGLRDPRTGSRHLVQTLRVPRSRDLESAPIPAAGAARSRLLLDGESLARAGRPSRSA